MVIKLYDYFSKPLSQQQQIDQTIFHQMSDIDKSLYYKILTDIKSGKIEYELIEYKADGHITVIVVSDILSREEFIINTWKNKLMRYDVGIIAGLLAKSIRRGWIHYTEEE